MDSTWQPDREYLRCLGSVENFVKRVRDAEDPRTQMLAKRAFLHRPIMTYSEFLMARNDQYLEGDSLQTAVVTEIDRIVESLNTHRTDGLCDYDFLRARLASILEIFVVNNKIT